MSAYSGRVNPSGFAGVCREVTENPQQEQQTSEVRILIRPDQMSEAQATGKANTSPAPDSFGSGSKG